MQALKLVRTLSRSVPCLDLSRMLSSLPPRGPLRRRREGEREGERRRDGPPTSTTIPASTPSPPLAPEDINQLFGLDDDREVDDEFLARYMKNSVAIDGDLREDDFYPVPSEEEEEYRENPTLDRLRRPPPTQKPDRTYDRRLSPRSGRESFVASSCEGREEYGESPSLNRLRRAAKKKSDIILYNREVSPHSDDGFLTAQEGQKEEYDENPSLDRPRKPTKKRSDRIGDRKLSAHSDDEFVTSPEEQMECEENPSLDRLRRPAKKSDIIYDGKISPHSDDEFLASQEGLKEYEENPSLSKLKRPTKKSNGKASPQFTSHEGQTELYEEEEESGEFDGIVRAEKQRRQKAKSKDEMPEETPFPRVTLTSEKEEMRKQGKENPTEVAERYRIKKTRVHAMLWQWELQKQAGEPVKAPEELDRELKSYISFESGNENETKEIQNDEAIGDTDISSRSSGPNCVITPPDWEGTVRTEKELIKENSAKEEQMLLEEFEQRMKFNKLQIAAFIKHHIFSRRRPVDGWSYIIEELGYNGKRGKQGGGQNFVSNLNGPRQRTDAT